MPKVGETVPLASLKDVQVGQSVPLSHLTGAPAPTAAPVGPATPTTDAGMLDHISNFVSSIFPGKQIGHAAGENLYGLWRLVHGDIAGYKAAADEVGSNFGPIVGDAAASAATPASMLVGGPEAAGVKAAAARIGVNAGVGAGLGAADAASKGGSIKDGAITGSVLNAGGSAGGEALSAVLNKLPVRLVRGVLPKLTPGNEQSVLQGTKLGTVSSMLEGAKNAVADHGNQINTILNHPQYVDHVGDGAASFDKVLSAFPNSDYDATQIVQTVKDLIPEQSKLVSKVQQGTATLAEKNTVRQALDAATKKRFTDSPQLTAGKAIGAKVADTLRHEVQSYAPETQPVFKTLSKEIDLRNALAKAQQKLDGKASIGLLDILSFMGAGLPGLVGEKLARSPAAAIGVAKALDGAKKAIPAIEDLAKGVRPAIINAATPGQTPQQ